MANIHPGGSIKTLNIKPDGNLVKGGQFTYSFDEKGNVTLSLKVVAHYLFANHNIEQHGTYKVNPDYLTSAKIKQGMAFEIGNLSLRVTSVVGFLAKADLVVKNIGTGSASIALGGKLIDLIEIIATGSVMGQTVTLDAA